MNPNDPIDFSDLDDLDSHIKNPQPKTVEESVEKWTSENASAQGAIYEEPCKDCHGSGRFYSYTGRYVGPCFKCKGSGKMMFKTSPETRAKRKAQAEAKKAAKAEALSQKTKQWVADHQAEFDFLTANNWSEFYRQMVVAIFNFGGLTENQLASVRKGMATAAAKAAEAAKRQEEAPKVSAVIEAFNAASESGLKRPRLVFGDIVLSQAAPNSANPGMIYVKNGDDYCGKIRQDGKFLSVRSCPQEVIEFVAKLDENVLEQAIAYGKETGVCCCCNAELTNPESIAAGIGPICAGRWGL